MKIEKLKDLLKGSGFEEIPAKIFNPDSGDSDKGGKKAIATAVNKKRRKDPNPDRRGKAKNVSNTKGK